MWMSTHGSYIWTFCSLKQGLCTHDARDRRSLQHHAEDKGNDGALLWGGDTYFELNDDPHLELITSPDVVDPPPKLEGRGGVYLPRHPFETFFLIGFREKTRSLFFQTRLFEKNTGFVNQPFHSEDSFCRRSFRMRFFLIVDLNEIVHIGRWKLWHRHNSKMYCCFWFDIACFPWILVLKSSVNSGDLFIFALNSEIDQDSMNNLLLIVLPVSYQAPKCEHEFPTWSHPGICTVLCEPWNAVNDQNQSIEPKAWTAKRSMIRYWYDFEPNWFLSSLLSICPPPKW